MSDVVVVTRWTRFGHDRLYVSAGGRHLGYWDLKTATRHPDTVELGPALQAALDEYWATRGVAPAPVPPPRRASEAKPAAAIAPMPHPVRPPDVAVGTPGGEAPPAQRPWTDLALNRPGAAVRDRAVAAREAAPVRTMIGRVFGHRTPERAWRIGADGEEAVAARLARLPDSWRVLHGVPIGNRGSDIDHVVIGPGGVYTVNAKHHPDTSVWVGGNTVIVNGQRQPYVRNSRYEAARSARILTELAGMPVFVTGLIAIVGAHDGLTIKSQPPGGDVHVVARKNITEWLLHRAPVMAPEQVEHLFDIARRSTTWLS